MAGTLQLKNFIPEQLTIKNPAKNLHHVFEEQDCYALWAAYASGRPLLLRGAPGTGKSQMAKAIAEQLGWAFVSEVIQGNTELSDLHWHFDAVARLGEAQVQAGQVDRDKLQEILNPRRFLAPGAFWWAYDWCSARKQYPQCATQLRPMPACPESWDEQRGGVVLLLDEIDKAEPDLPNGLLETLGQYQFNVPFLSHESYNSTDKADVLHNPIRADPKRLLVIITTNEERELPRAFVRRCLVHTLKMENSDEWYQDEQLLKSPEPRLQKRHHWLIERGRLHFGAAVSEQAYFLAAKLLWDDRDANPHSLYPPGLAEYIDLLTAIHTLKPSEQEDRLRKIADYALKKEVNV
ncbi:AAA family ATPase [Thiofilum flexile]|uniref:AAA family ATPase n=1 Tax=Thiofilum flexile TaxID=125627 RepID=UPI00036BECC8|nr:MoxR family ATPase [Thiofilum flexile]